MKLIAFIVVFFSLTILSYSQDTCRATFVFEKTTYNGNEKLKIINPKKSIELIVDDQLSYYLKNPIFINDSTIYFKKGFLNHDFKNTKTENGIISMSIIKQIRGKYYNPKNVLPKILLLVVGTGLFQVGFIGAESVWIGGGAEDLEMRKIQQNEANKYRRIAIFGGITFFCGLCVPLHIRISSNNNWKYKIIKVK